MFVSALPRTVRPLLHRALPACLLTLCASLASAQANAPAERAGTVKLVQGEVRLGNEPSAPILQPGDAVRAGDRIRTGLNGAASLVLRDGTVLTLGPNSTANLSQFQFNSTTQEGNLLVDLLEGSVRVVTGLLSKLHPERLKVKTPTVVVGVRGTDFIVEAAHEENPPLRFYINHDWRDHSRLHR